MNRPRSATTVWLALAAAAVVFGAISVFAVLSRSPSAVSRGLASNPNLDPGTTLSGRAPDFRLTDQFGRSVSLRSFRGHVVVLAFVDSRCTTVCPLTTTAMIDAKRLLGNAGNQVRLVGVDANPTARSVGEVRAYSTVHDMFDKWHFLTGSLSQLKRVWAAYHVASEVEHGQIDHTPALFVLDQRGFERKVYLTEMAYASVNQAGQLLAHEIARLLPHPPRVPSAVSYAQIPSIGPKSPVTLPRSGGGTVRLGPAPGPRLLLFFATWVAQTSALAPELDELNRYQAQASADRLPPLTAVDEASVEPSPRALPTFMHRLSRPLAFPVGIDRSGRVADGYQVQDEPWLVLVSPAGRILWYEDPSTSGWLTDTALVQHVRDALSRPATSPTSSRQTQQELAGSPPVLAALHRQASRLVGGSNALFARIRALRGYPIVINAWASWCSPCRQEFELFASASARYGQRVAFLGANTSDSSADARAFLAQHPVSYPSFRTTAANIGPLAKVAGLPTTIFINPAGRVVYVHTGQYVVQGSLDEDIRAHALGG